MSGYSYYFSNYLRKATKLYFFPFYFPVNNYPVTRYLTDENLLKLTVNHKVLTNLRGLYC